MKIDNDDARKILREEALKAESDSLNNSWVGKVKQLSKLCDEGGSFTHIAFLVTAMLAKSVNRNADLFMIKPKLSPDSPYAYSARSLCHSVIVPLSAELGFSIGVTGREPLNNQPYFRMSYLGDETPVHERSRPAFDYLVDLIGQLNQLKSEKEARKALRAFVFVRREHQPKYTHFTGGTKLTPDELVLAIRKFVEADSEKGRRAQAVVAGLMDAFAGAKRVESGRVNDPSRKHPGDVCVRSQNKYQKFEKAIEVRDKPVSMNEVQIFGKKCIDMAVREVALVMVSSKQKKLDVIVINSWADKFGVGITLFYGWEQFVQQVLFWSSDAKPVLASRAARLIHDRLVGAEVSPKGVELWDSIVGNSPNRQRLKSR